MSKNLWDPIEDDTKKDCINTNVKENQKYFFEKNEPLSNVLNNINFTIEKKNDTIINNELKTIEDLLITIK